MDLSPDEENFQGRLLHLVALWDNLELLQELLASGAEVDARDAYMRSVLHAVALAERSSCLTALCAAGAEVDAKSDQATGGKTALHIAAERGHAENVKALLNAGADLTLLTSDGDSALVLAERDRHRHASLALREAKDAEGTGGADLQRKLDLLNGALDAERAEQARRQLQYVAHCAEGRIKRRIKLIDFSKSYNR